MAMAFQPTFLALCFELTFLQACVTNMKFTFRRKEFFHSPRECLRKNKTKQELSVSFLQGVFSSPEQQA